MADETSLFIHKVKEILASGDYTFLESYKNPANWQSLQASERELLGQIFTKRGEQLLNVNIQEGFDLLERAVKIVPDNFDILKLVGFSLATQEQNVRALNAAIRSLKEALTINPDSFEASFGLIKTLFTKGKLLEEESCFNEARHFCENLSIQSSLQPGEIQGEFYFCWATILFYLAKASGEVIDFTEAGNKFGEAETVFNAISCSTSTTSEQEEPQFLRRADIFKSYGDVFLELSRLLGRENLCREAIEFYQKSLILSHDNADGWYNLGLCYTILFDNLNETEHFNFADHCFVNAAKLEPEHPLLWGTWGGLYLTCAKLNEDVKFFDKSIEKFVYADAIEANHSWILSGWGEALLLKGTTTEQIFFLKAAEKKFIHCIKLQPDNDYMWQLYGSCCNELGRYFNAESYFYDAIDKFQHGLAINKCSPLLWHGLGYSYFALGEMKSDLSLIEKACQFCVKAMENGAIGHSQFWNDWGVSLMKMAELTHNKSYAKSALEKFENAIGLQNSEYKEHCDTELLYNYGCALDFIGDFSEDVRYYEKAIEILQKVLKQEPNHPHVRYNLALAISHLGELTSEVELLEKAIDFFEIIILRDAEDELAWNEYGLSLLSLAQLVHDVTLPHKSQKYYEQAESKFHQAASLGCTQAYYNLACYHSLLRNQHAALFYLEKAQFYNALPSIDEMMHDEWLTDLRQTSAFQAFINNFKSKDAS